jgi:hypothetical protein
LDLLTDQHIIIRAGKPPGTCLKHTATGIDSVDDVECRLWQARVRISGELNCEHTLAATYWLDIGFMAGLSTCG